MWRLIEQLLPACVQVDLIPLARLWQRVLDIGAGMRNIRTFAFPLGDMFLQFWGARTSADGYLDWCFKRAP